MINRKDKSMINELKVKRMHKRLKQAVQMNKILLVLLIIVTILFVNNKQVKQEVETKVVVKEQIEEIVPLLPEEPMFITLENAELYKLPPLPKVK